MVLNGERLNRCFVEKFLEVMGVTKLTNDELAMTSPVKLAYLGDAIYEIHIRSYLMNEKKGKVNDLNQMAVAYVNASAQGYAARELETFLDAKEWRILKRGRNYKSTPPKNANVSDYKYATGIEALLGHLYIEGKNDRIYEIMRKCIELIDSRGKNE